MTDEHIKILRKIFNEKQRLEHEATCASFAAKKDLIAASIQNEESKYAAKSIVFGSRVTATSTSGLDSWTGIYVGHRWVFGVVVEPFVMRITKDGIPHKIARIVRGNQDWRLADD
jgi:hypothetical protein